MNSCSWFLLMPLAGMVQVMSKAWQQNTPPIPNILRYNGDRGKICLYTNIIPLLGMHNMYASLPHPHSPIYMYTHTVHVYMLTHNNIIILWYSILSSLIHTLYNHTYAAHSSDILLLICTVDYNWLCIILVSVNRRWTNTARFTWLVLMIQT